MRCRDIDKLSTAYVDGELDNARASALRGHLHQCERCQALMAAEADLRDVAEQLDPIDPPDYLWNNIGRGLARAEMADAERSRLWLWWQGARQHMLPAAVACAAIVLVVAWLSRRDEQPFGDVVALTDVPSMTQTPRLKTAVASSGGTINDLAPTTPKVALTQTFTESRIDEIDRADARYGAVINELKKMVTKEREAWSEPTSKRFDAKLAALEKKAHDQRAQVGPPESDPSKRDALYVVYRAQIDLLQGASFGEVPK